MSTALQQQQPGRSLQQVRTYQREEILIFTRLEVLNRQRAGDYNSQTHDTRVRVNPSLHVLKIYGNSIGIAEWFNV